MSDHAFAMSFAAFIEAIPPDLEFSFAVRRLPTGLSLVRSGGVEASASQESAPVSSSGGNVADPRSPTEKAPQAETSLEAARRLGADSPTLSLTIAGWATKLCHTNPELRRELQRAKDNGILGVHSPGEGRSNRAHLLPVDAIIAYFALVDEVRRGAKSPPAWFREVVRPRGTRA